MSQTSLLPVRITNEVDATSFSFDGKDLKRVAQCDDGHSYAMKRVQDGALIPLAEWVGYHLCRRCAILTPDFTVLHDPEGQPPSFGSRIATYAQIEHDPGSFRVASFFSGHHDALSAIYSLDAIVINPDRHARNIFVEHGHAKQPARVRAFDFSRAWLRTGAPFGNTEAMRDSATQKWWKTFHRLGCRPSQEALSLLQGTDATWLLGVIESAPEAWRASVDVDAAVTFWERQRLQRIDWAQRWLT